MIGKIRQYGLVYKDISDKIKFYKDVFDMKINTIDIKISKNIYNEKIEPYKLRFGLFMMDKIQIEFIQVLEGKTIYNSFLENTSGGFHHIGIYVDDLDIAIKKIEKNNIKQLTNGKAPGTRFAYYNTKKMLGYETELIELK